MAQDRNKRAADIPVWEWVFAAVGAVFVAFTFGFLAYTALTADGTPPRIHVRVEAVVPVERGYLVTISAVNRGGQTAANVRIEGELKAGSSTVEKSDMSFQYVPAGSHRKGGLFFAQDPRQLDVVVRPRGYESP